MKLLETKHGEPQGGNDLVPILERVIESPEMLPGCTQVDDSTPVSGWIHKGFVTEEN